MIATQRPINRGFTLIETVVVITVIGVVAVVLAGMFSIIVRTTPTTEARAADSRSLLGLSTWLPADVSATPQVPVATASVNWDSSPTTASGCSGTDPGSNLLRLSWHEQIGGSSTTFIANYRLIDTGSTSKVVRLTCTPGGSPKTDRMTADLPASATTPVTVQWKTQVRSGVTYIVGAEMEVTTLRNQTLRVDASSRNPNETLGAIPVAVTTTTVPASTTTAPSTTTTTTVSATTTTVVGGNHPPTASPATFTGRRDDPINLTLIASDVDLDPLAVTFGTLPTGWSATSTGLDVTINAINPAAGTYVIDYHVTDPSSETASSTMTINLTPIPCVASYASPAASPNPVDRVGNGNNPSPLATPVTVTIQKSGDCSNLVLRYTPDATPRTLVFGASLAVTIPGGTGTEAWAYGDHDLQLVLDPAQPSESVLVTTTLTVKKN